MAPFRNIFLPVVILAVVFAITAQPSSASVFLGKDRYVSAIGDTLDDDLFLGCEEAAIDGYIANDLIIAAKRYTLSGDVGGNLNSASQFATIRGTIFQSARIFAQRVTIDGQIHNNLIVCASDIEIGRAAWIGKDAMVLGSDISISGTIAGDLIIRGDQVVISGKINGDVDIESNRITLLSPAEITGNLKYKSKKELRIDDDVVVSGEIDWVEVKPKDKDSDSDNGIPFGLRVVLFLASMVTGLLIIWVFNYHTRTAAAVLIESPLPTLGFGLVAVLFSPVAMLILLPTLVGIPASLILMFTYTIFFYIAKIYVALAVGQLVTQKLLGMHLKQGWSFIIGLVIITALFWIPVAGWFVYLGTLFFGFGAILLGIRKCNQAGKASSAGLQAPGNLSPPPPLPPPMPPPPPSGGG